MADGRPIVPESWIRQVAEEVARRLGSSAAAAQCRPSPTGADPAGATANAACSTGAIPNAWCRPIPPGVAPVPNLPARRSGAVATPHCPECPPGGTCAQPLPGGTATSPRDGSGAGDGGEHYRLLIEHGVDRVACCPSLGSVDRRLAAMIDHTLLRPDATDRQIAQLCEEAHCYGFATVCLQPIWVPLAVRVLEGSRCRVCTVVGFPHGANRAEVKAYETQLAVAQGAREIDMVIPIGAMKSGDQRCVAAHIRAVVKAAMPGVVTKVILETAFLTDEEKRAACRIARAEGATFVKTSTGFGPSGATLDDIRLMREAVGPHMGVKAAGGIRDRETAVRMVEAGATRIGASASIRIAGGRE